jgi:D-alanine-D-alanine ligase
MKKKANVIVLMGGRTPEYEISLISGKEVVKNLPKKYRPLPVVISRDGKLWQLVDKKTILSFDNPLGLLGTGKGIKIPKGKRELIDLRERSSMIDVCFIAMHGPYGEDGTVQGMLELAGIPYTGPGVLASAIGMDKAIFRKVLEAEGIPVPKYVVMGKSDSLTKIQKVLGNPPYFVKPSNQGSSVGTSIIREKKDLKKALDEAFEYSTKVLVDEYMKGLELTCGVIGNEKPKALPLVEIRPLKGEYFDYDSKYTESGAEEIVPARIPKSLTKKIQKMALGVYRAIGARGFSRVDFLLKGKNSPVVLEINTIPGLTPMSLLPKAAKEAGYTYGRFLDSIIKYAIQKN